MRRLSLRREPQVCPPSASVHLPAAVKRAIWVRPAWAAKAQTSGSEGNGENVNFYQLEDAGVNEPTRRVLENASRARRKVPDCAPCRRNRAPDAERRAAFPQPVPPATKVRKLCESSLLLGCYSIPASSKPGSTLVPSTATDFSSSGSIPSACKMVGATCEVATGLFTTLATSVGFETIRPTLVSL